MYYFVGLNTKSIKKKSNMHYFLKGFQLLFNPSLGDELFFDQSKGGNISRYFQAPAHYLNKVLNVEKEKIDPKSKKR